MGINRNQWHFSLPRRHMSQASQALRDWAIAHAGNHQSQAKRQIKLGANGQWESDRVTIVIRTVSNALIPELQLVRASIKPDRQDQHDPALYTAHAISWRTGANPDQGNIVAAATDPWTDEERPWDEHAGFNALASTLHDIQAKAGRTAGRTLTVYGRDALDEDNLAAAGEMVMLLPWGDQDQPEECMSQIAADFSKHYNTVVLDHGAARAIGRSIDCPDQAMLWNRASFGLYQRDMPGKPGLVTFVTHDPEQARHSVLQAIDDQRQAQEQLATHTLCALTEITAALASNGTVHIPTEAQHASDQETQNPRISVLEDQLKEARDEASKLRETLEQKENELQAAYSALQSDKVTDAEEDAPREMRGVIERVIEEQQRFPNLRFLNSATKHISKHRQPNPNHEEVLAALDAIHHLATAWQNTPNGRIGNWRQYFNNLTGWHYAQDESEQTKTKHGVDRNFRDEERDQTLIVYRHVTYHSRNSSFQIYFDLDQKHSEFVVAYMGRHLPYATET